MSTVITLLGHIGLCKQCRPRSDAICFHQEIRKRRPKKKNIRFSGTAASVQKDPACMIFFSGKFFFRPTKIRVT